MKTNVLQNISEKLINIDFKIPRKDAIKLYREADKDYIYNLEIKYPYCNKPTHPLNKLGKNQFILSLQNRFAYNEINNDEVYLTPQEIQNESVDFNIPKIEIIETNHSKNLYEELRLFEKTGQI